LVLVRATRDGNDDRGDPPRVRGGDPQPDYIGGTRFWYICY